MNNAEKPAYPAEQAIPYEYEDFCEFSGKSTIKTAYKDAKGLTKREKFAMAAMQGLLSDVKHWYEIRRMAKDQNKKNSKVLSELSIECADALLKKLEETQ